MTKMSLNRYSSFSLDVFFKIMNIKDLMNLQFEKIDKTLNRYHYLIEIRQKDIMPKYD